MLGSVGVLIDAGSMLQRESGIGSLVMAWALLCGMLLGAGVDFAKGVVFFTKNGAG